MFVCLEVPDGCLVVGIVLPPCEAEAATATRSGQRTSARTVSSTDIEGAGICDAGFRCNHNYTATTTTINHTIRLVTLALQVVDRLLFGFQQPAKFVDRLFGLAGDLAAEQAGQRGMVASDITAFLPAVLNPV